MSILIETAKVNDVTMRFFRFGNGKKTLVVLPGLSVKSVMESATAIAGQYKVFREEYTVFVFDRREMLPATYSVAQMAEDTAAVMYSLGLQNTCVFGASQGGMMAMLIAANHPKLVAKLALGSTCAAVSEKEYAVIRHWATLAKERKREELYADFCRTVYPPTFYERFADFFKELSHQTTDEELSRFAVLCEGTKAFDARKQLCTLHLPVIVLSSEDDALIGKEATQEMIALIQKNCALTTHTYTDRAHAAYDTAKDYAQRLKDFFDEAP